MKLRVLVTGEPPRLVLADEFGRLLPGQRQVYIDNYAGEQPMVLVDFEDVTIEVDPELLAQAKEAETKLAVMNMRPGNTQLRILGRLVRELVDNDPNEPISDAGHTVLDSWRQTARQALKNFFGDRLP